MTRMNKYRDVAMILSSLEHFHRVHQSQCERIMMAHGIEEYNETEERFHRLIRKYNRKFERMRKRTKFYKLIKKYDQND